MQQRSRFLGMYAVFLLLACRLWAQEADLRLVSSPPLAFFSGTALTYTVLFANFGATAQNLVITDPLPPYTTFVSVQPAPGWACGLSTGGGQQAVRCTAPSLSPPVIFTNWSTMKITLGVAPDIPLGTALSNTVTISSDTPESNTSNNTATDTHIISVADTIAVVSVTSSASPVVVPVGELATLVLTVKNLGPSGAYYTTLQDTLPSCASFAGIDAPGWRCTLPPVGASGQIFCERDQFLPGVESIRFFVRANQVGQGSNTAIIHPEARDDNFTPTSWATTTGFVAIAPIVVPALSLSGLAILGIALLVSGIALLGSRV